MANRLYVGNISWGTTEESLIDWFNQCGTVVEARIMIDRDSGRSRGFGFVSMSADEEAERAIVELDGRDLDGRPLKVNEARERKERPQSHKRGRHDRRGA